MRLYIYIVRNWGPRVNVDHDNFGSPIKVVHTDGTNENYRTKKQQKQISTKGTSVSGTVSCDYELVVTDEIRIVIVQLYHYQRRQRKVFEPGRGQVKFDQLWWLWSCLGHVHGLSTGKLKSSGFQGGNTIRLRRKDMYTGYFMTLGTRLSWTMK